MKSCMVYFLSPFSKIFRTHFFLLATRFYYVLLAPVMPVGDIQSLNLYTASFPFLSTVLLALQGHFSQPVFQPDHHTLFIQRTKGYGFTVNQGNNLVGKGQLLSPGIPQKEA